MAAAEGGMSRCAAAHTLEQGEVRGCEPFKTQKRFKVAVSNVKKAVQNPLALELRSSMSLMNQLDDGFDFWKGGR